MAQALLEVQSGKRLPGASHIGGYWWRNSWAFGLKLWVKRGYIRGAISIGVTGGFLGHRVGKKAGQIVDKNIFLDYQCNACKHRFAVQHAVQINKE